MNSRNVFVARAHNHDGMQYLQITQIIDNTCKKQQQNITLDVNHLILLNGFAKWYKEIMYKKSHHNGRIGKGVFLPRKNK